MGLDRRWFQDFPLLSPLPEGRQTEGVNAGVEMVWESLVWFVIPPVPPVTFLSSTRGIVKRGTEEEDEGNGVMDNEEEEVEEVEAAELVEETEVVDLLPIFGDMRDFQLLSSELNF